jgi:antitoxin MazE3
MSDSGRALRGGRGAKHCWPGWQAVRIRIPSWYHSGMSKQIAVRLPDELVAFVDEIVASGRERSRAAVVSRALEREQRRTVAARDAEILTRTGPDPALERLADHAAGLPIES